MQPPLFTTIVWLFTHDSLHFVDDVIVAFQKAERELQYLTLCNNVFYTIVMGWAFDYFLHLTNASSAIDFFCYPGCSMQRLQIHLLSSQW